jgi:type 1 glutamine amidotransferase/sugar phosphate isomerase/epimerase
MASPATCCWRWRLSDIEMGMKQTAESRALAGFIAMAAVGLWMAPVAGQAPPGAGRGGNAVAGRGTPGRGAASLRWEAWSAMRSAATAIIGWKIGVDAGGFRPLSFYDSVAKIDLLGVAYLEGASTQKFDEEIPKNLDDNLAPGELNAVKDRLNALSLTMTAYRVPAIGPGEDSARRLFEFARNVGVETIVSDSMPDAFPLIDKLAGEYGMNVAVCGDPEKVLAAIGSLTQRVGVCGDTGAWVKEGIKPLDELRQLKGRLLVLHIAPGTPAIAELLRGMYTLELKPSLITVNGTPGAFDEFEKALRPVLADKVDQMSRAAPIRGPDRLSAEAKSQIDAALPAKAVAAPKKTRKLLVLDLNIAYPGHQSIPAENYGLEQMGKRTGAWEAVFSNDLDNLKYDKIRQFDAVFLNNTVGMIFVDPEVREGLLRFVRDGGGIGGNHGTSHVSMDWPEFHEMIGVVRGIHRENTEKAWIRIDDPASPLTVPFAGKEFLYMDEFFRFPTPPYSREKLHVLLSMDVGKTDMNQGRPCQWPCARPDHDYAVSWIRSYGKGRVFFAILGHQPTIFTTPPLADYFFRGIQFILGDLNADTTPSAKLSAAR